MRQAIAYDVVSTEAHREVRSIIQGLCSEIASGYIEDEESLEGAIHEACDSALTYTSDQWLFAWGLPDADDDMGEAETFEAGLTQKAYQNLREAVTRGGQTDFAEAMQVAEDKRLEAGQS